MKKCICLLLILLSVSLIQSVAAENLPQADLLNVSFNSEGYVDAAGVATITKSENLSIVYDDALKLNVAHFSGTGYRHTDGSFIANDFVKAHFGKTILAAHTNAFTAEVYFSLDSLPATGSLSVCPISGQQAGGLGFEVDSKGTLTFFCRTGSAYNKPKKDNAIEAEKYYHAVGVFTGTAVELYLNGELVATEAANGPTIAWPGTEEHNALVIGGDIGIEGKADHGITGNVVLAKAYSVALTSAQASTEYQEVLKLSVVTEPTTAPETEPETQTPPETNPSTSDSGIILIFIEAIAIAITCVFAKKRVYHYSVIFKSTRHSIVNEL